MAMRFNLILLLFLISFKAEAGDALEYSAYTLIAVDWMQTVEISRNDDYIEKNRFLGEYPSERDVHLYMASRMLASYLINKYTDFYEMWNFYIVVETGAAVINNYNIGIRISF